MQCPFCTSVEWGTCSPAVLHRLHCALLPSWPNLQRCSLKLLVLSMCVCFCISMLLFPRPVLLFPRHAADSDKGCTDQVRGTQTTDDQPSALQQQRSFEPRESASFDEPGRSETPPAQPRTAQAEVRRLRYWDSCCLFDENNGPRCQQRQNVQVAGAFPGNMQQPAQQNRALYVNFAH